MSLADYGAAARVMLGSTPIYSERKYTKVTFAPRTRGDIMVSTPHGHLAHVDKLEVFVDEETGTMITDIAKYEKHLAGAPQ